jgi:hypothetical protein
VESTVSNGALVSASQAKIPTSSPQTTQKIASAIHGLVMQISAFSVLECAWPVIAGGKMFRIMEEKTKREM